MIDERIAERTEADLAKLAAARGVPSSSVTVATYPVEVEALLRSRFGMGLIFERKFEDPMTPASG